MGDILSSPPLEQSKDIALGDAFNKYNITYSSSTRPLVEDELFFDHDLLKYPGIGTSSRGVLVVLGNLDSPV